MCYLVAGVTPTPLDAGHAARMLLLGVDHTTPGGLKCMQQLLPLMRSEVYEWARLLAGEQGNEQGLPLTVTSGDPFSSHFFSLHALLVVANLNIVL